MRASYQSLLIRNLPSCALAIDQPVKRGTKILCGSLSTALDENTIL